MRAVLIACWGFLGRLAAGPAANAEVH